MVFASSVQHWWQITFLLGVYHKDCVFSMNLRKKIRYFKHSLLFLYEQFTGLP